jgi:hypothetical protein
VCRRSGGSCGRGPREKLGLGAAQVSLQAGDGCAVAEADCQPVTKRARYCTERSEVQISKSTQKRCNGVDVVSITLERGFEQWLERETLGRWCRRESMQNERLCSVAPHWTMAGLAAHPPCW